MEQKEEKGGLLLAVCTPGGSRSIACDSVRLFLTDDRAGNGGGFLGIRRGHAPMAAALGRGPVRAYLAGRLLFEECYEGGVAYVENDRITILPRPKGV